jgi:hypothetical protein
MLDDLNQFVSKLSLFAILIRDRSSDRGVSLRKNVRFITLKAAVVRDPLEALYGAVRQGRLFQCFSVLSRRLRLVVGLIYCR